MGRRIPAMANETQEEGEAGRLRRQRNLFRAVAAVAVASIGAALPRKVANYRELRAANAHVVELQAEIVDAQRHIRIAQEQILGYQATIRAWQKL
jgi:hypothetical protein